MGIGKRTRMNDKMEMANSKDMLNTIIQEAIEKEHKRLEYKDPDKTYDDWISIDTSVQETDYQRKER
jgi:hypothetical protein